MQFLTIIYPVDLEEKKLSETREKIKKPVKEINQELEISFNKIKEEIKEYLNSMFAKS